MGLLLRFFISFCFFFPVLTWGQTFQYQLEGTYVTEFSNNNPPSLNPPIALSPVLRETPAIPVSVPVTVNFKIKWNESANSIQGIYQDNYFTDLENNIVTGSVTGNGRSFSVILPTTKNGVRSITLSTTQTGSVTGSIPMRITTTNDIGGRVSALDTFAIMRETIDPPAVTNNCSIGFGSLTGFCGLYGGTFSEIADAQNRCNLLMGGNPRLELGINTVFTIYLNYIDTIDNLPFHRLGTFVASPDSTQVSVSRRHCGPLPETTFPSDHCTVLTLNASFFNTAGNATVSGNYTITDEVTNETCVHNLFLTRDVTY